ncbi:filament-like plant protein 4 [Durio zibethinus]|uniref:Filament-like plant protein 4 n=1 Tax=Durio zibethinus TaxID=66656 RepID=A0A6P6B655_DURZI|nr:filament-like plant protein 4 [Durio zibethinus]XP_022772667.1 filament-like plant protein 4 [Durio zibethinus]XP_022772668.1 filament-like plant protein 4 [Durio zibethinus]
MDRRWPWKKKSSDKAAAAAAATLASAASEADWDNYKKSKYVQISVESYSHLTDLENQLITYEEQVQTLEDEIKDLNEKLSAANSEITNKEDLVKQHTKVAEEAVSGWEKAEAEALALKNHLESVTLLKLTAEDRASHLDGALKECMRQIRNLKEEHDQKLQDVAISKNKQCEKIKLDLEAKIANLDQELLKSETENAAILRSLQERSNMLIKINEEKSQAEAEVEILKGNIESCEREINSLKYELHVVSKELEIRNEEKNMSMRSAEAANKQHMEGAKKIAKLEAECQRLRGLVRKKLPGPAALAQMKLEVESLGRDYGDTRLKRSPVMPSTPHLSTVTDFSVDNAQKFHKENEFLRERLLAMEEETKMLKEALAKCNSELLASRNLCARTSNKLQTLEAQLAIINQQRSPSKAIVQIPAEPYSSQNASNPPSVTSVSEDGNDDDRSCADSWATALISELSQFKKEKSTEKSNKTENAKHLDLMDDFLEMEKLACSSNDSTANGAITISGCTTNKISETVNGVASREISCKELQSEKQHDLSPSVNHVSSNMDLSVVYPGSDADKLPVMRLQTRLTMVLESMSKDADVQKILEDIKSAVQDVHDTLSQNPVNGISEEVHDSDGTCNGQAYPGDSSLTAEKEIAKSPGDMVTSETVQIISQELAAAVSQIHDFVLSLGKEARSVDDISSDGNGLSQKIVEFSVTYDKFLCSNVSLDDFIFNLSTVLAKACELRFNVLGYKGNEVEINSPHCIDKVALPENKVTQKDSSGGRYQNGCAHISNPTSNLEVPDDGNLVLHYESKQLSKFTPEEFEGLKLEKENMAMNLSRSTENLEMTKSQLHETEQHLAEAKFQLASAQKSNSLAETQLKCMAESYRSLETRAEELETEVNLLQVKIETLQNKLQDEKGSHHDALARCKELEEQLQRNESCFVCSSAADNDLKSKQEKELAAAAEKLAECQETIFLLGKQLKSLRPQTDMMGSPYNDRSQKDEGFHEAEPTTSGLNLQDLDQAEIDTAASGNASRTGAESPMESFNMPCSPSDVESNILRSPINSNNLKHKSTMPSTSSTSSTPTPEKHSRGFSRFFSSKGKNGH